MGRVRKKQQFSAYNTIHVGPAPQPTRVPHHNPRGYNTTTHMGPTRRHMPTLCTSLCKHDTEADGSSTIKIRGYKNKWQPWKITVRECEL